MLVEINPLAIFELSRVDSGGRGMSDKTLDMVP